MERVNLSSLKHCPQQWENMTPCERGRICSKCDIAIIDFRNKTDKEIAEVHLFAKEKVCGVYTEKQLVDKRSKVPRGKFSFLYHGFLGLLSILNVSCFDEKGFAIPERLALSYHKDRIYDERSTLAIDSGKMFLFGYIKNQNGNMPYANIYVYGTKTGVTSNANGYYCIELTEFLNKKTEVALIVNEVGYSMKQFRVFRKDFVSLPYTKRDVKIGETSNMTSFRVSTR